MTGRNSSGDFTRNFTGEERRGEGGEEREGSSVDYSTLVCQSGSVDYRARGRGGKEQVL